MQYRRVNISVPAGIHDAASDASREQAVPLSRAIADFLAQWSGLGAPRQFRVTSLSEIPTHGTRTPKHTAEDPAAA